jgi:hypothetical protein
MKTSTKMWIAATSCTVCSVASVSIAAVVFDPQAEISALSMLITGHVLAFAAGRMFVAAWFAMKDGQ